MDRKSLYLRFVEDKLKLFRSEIAKLNLDHGFFSVEGCTSSLKTHLLTECDFYCLPTIVYEINLRRLQKSLKGVSSKDRYEYYFRHFNFFEDYPKLVSLLEEFTSSTVNSLLEAVRNIKEDRSHLILRFRLSDKDILKEINFFPNGDRHFGKQTMKLTFSSGVSLVYKSQIIQNEQLTAEIFDLVNRYIKDGKVKNYLFLDRKNRFYKEFIKYDGKVNSRQDAQNFYLEMGHILAICYLTNATDIHMENLVANDGHVYVIDRETFFHHNQIIGFSDENDLFATGLLANPNPQGTKASSVTGIFGGQESRLSLTVPLVQNDHIDIISLKYIGLSKFKQHNRIFYSDGKIIDPLPFSGSISDGFIEVVKLFETHKNSIVKILKRHKDAKFRQIIRKTSLYAILIRQMFQPYNLKNKFYEQELKTKILSLCKNETEKTKILVDYEVEELTKLNIPYFYTELFSKDLFYGVGLKIKNFFDKTPFEKFNAKLKKLMTEAELHGLDFS